MQRAISICYAPRSWVAEELSATHQDRLFAWLSQMKWTTQSGGEIDEVAPLRLSSDVALGPRPQQRTIRSRQPQADFA